MRVRLISGKDASRLVKDQSDNLCVVEPAKISCVIDLGRHSSSHAAINAVEILDGDSRDVFFVNKISVKDLTSILDNI